MKKMMSFVVCLAWVVAGTATAQPQQGAAREPYLCQYLENAPHGVMSWAQSERVKQGTGTESRFVPYNSESAQLLWLDATAVRDISTTGPSEGRATSFNMVYDEKGWYIYIHCREPDIQSYIDQGKDIMIELFFAPGLENVPYYQLMIRQLAKTVDYVDWGTESRDYRSLKGRATVESLALPDGVATFLFIPWDALYDRVPLNGETWRFSFMRWGGEAVTWGGKVHDTGNFGRVKFEKPAPEVADTIRRNNLRKAWFTFQKTAAKANEHLGDGVMGDPEFFKTVLQPVIEKYKSTGQAMGAPGDWTDAAMKDSAALTKNLMEFDYEIESLRTRYLLDNLFQDAR